MKALVLDAQVEYVNAAGRARRSNVEVTSERYRAQPIRAKPRAGFPLDAASAQPAPTMRRVLGGESNGRRAGGRLGQQN